MATTIQQIETYNLHGVVEGNDQELADCSARAQQETWEDMVRQQREGLYPAAFNVIQAPVLMFARYVPCIPIMPSHNGSVPGKAPRPIRDVVTGI